jgi:hypothetical protein
LDDLGLSFAEPIVKKKKQEILFTQESLEKPLFATNGPLAIGSASMAAP